MTILSEKPSLLSSKIIKIIGEKPPIISVNLDKHLNLRSTFGENHGGWSNNEATLNQLFSGFGFKVYISSISKKEEYLCIQPPIAILKKQSQHSLEQLTEVLQNETKLAELIENKKWYEWEYKYRAEDMLLNKEVESSNPLASYILPQLIEALSSLN